MTISEDEMHRVRFGMGKAISDETLAVLTSQAAEDGAQCGGFTMRLLLTEVHRLRDELGFYRGICDGKREAEQTQDAQCWLDESPGRSVTFTQVRQGYFEATVSRPSGKKDGPEMTEGVGINLQEAFLAAKVKL